MSNLLALTMDGCSVCGRLARRCCDVPVNGRPCGALLCDLHAVSLDDKHHACARRHDKVELRKVS